MTLDEVQDSVDRWITAHGGYWDRFAILARLTEELGEIASDLQRLEGLRPRTSETDLGHEVGDLLFTLAAFANASDLNLAQAFADVMAKYEERDGDAWQGQASA